LTLSIYQSSALLAEASKLRDKLTEWRRDFHQHPELGFEEIRTSGIVAEHLEKLGLEVQRGVGKTGVVATLHGTQPGPTIALRADMDALPMQDQKQVPYRSQVPGKAHTCGHDAHTSILMGTAQFLVEQKIPFKGNIKFIFQPAEEGLAGAQAMIEDGVLENPKVDAIAGLHVFYGAPTGRVTVVRGVAMAAADRIAIKIIGKGGHAAHPHRSIDSVSVTAEVLSALQHIVSRQVDPLQSAVITIGQINGGTASNIIAPEVVMKGTVRTLNEAIRSEMPARIEKVIKGVTEALGASYEFEYTRGYPTVSNDDVMVDHMWEAATKVLGGSKVELSLPSMGGEDFSYYTHHVPGVFFRLGVGSDEKNIEYPHHHPLFDIDEDGLPIGVAMLTQIALTYLEKTTDK